MIQRKKLQGLISGLLLLIVLLFITATPAAGQTGTAMRSLHTSIKAITDSSSIQKSSLPEDYNPWGGAVISSTFIGQEEDFHLDHIGVKGKLIIDWLSVPLGDNKELSFLIYGNIADPRFNPSLSAFKNLSDPTTGLALTLQTYSMLGRTAASDGTWFTPQLSFGIKLNKLPTPDGKRFYMFRAGAGLEGAFSVPSLSSKPFTINITPAYNFTAQATEFLAIQREVDVANYWSVDWFTIVPVSNTFGALIQGSVIEDVGPTVAAGLIIVTPLFK